MAGRRTNLALLGLLVMALATGGLALALGTGWAAWAVVAHGAVGLGIALLAPWKSIIARRSLRRRRPGSAPSLALAFLVGVALVTGLGHATGLLLSFGPVTAMQVHVTASLVAIPLVVWHLVARPIRPRRTDVSRRNLLRAGGLVTGSLAAFAVVAGVVRVAGLPGRRRRFTGSYERGSFDPGAMPVTQWLDDSVPSIDPASWRLAIEIPGRNRMVLTVADLDARREPVTALIDCTDGWYAEQEWQGVRFDRLLPPVEGRSVLVRSVTGYARRFPLRDAGHLWLASRVDGEQLSAGHGAPARVVAPGRRGFWWVKWVESIEVSDRPWWLQSPFPLT